MSRHFGVPDMTNMRITGRCLCGAVTYSINAQPLGMGQCHCKDCQRASGTGHMSLARFKKDDVTIKGQTRAHRGTTPRQLFLTTSACLRRRRRYGLRAAFGAASIFQNRRRAGPGPDSEVLGALRIHAAGWYADLPVVARTLA